MPMKPLTRRDFGKVFFAFGALPFAQDSLRDVRSGLLQTEAIQLPERIAGYVMTEEERRLATKFLHNHEKNIAPLRELELPNGLAPSYVFASPTVEGGQGEK